MSTETSMTIENTSWTLENLLNNRDIINKPKFQRDQKWTIEPKNNKPNYKDYIIFLIDNKNSVIPISLGTEIKNNKENYIVIDGNNRINAIIKFLQKPYCIFPEYYNKVIEFINNCKYTDDILKEECKNIITNLNYKKISNFTTLNKILVNFVIHGDLHKNIENELCKIQEKMRYKEQEPFNINIKLNINIFKNGTYNEYCKIFEDINKHANTLSENELLSAILFNTNITINDTKFKHILVDKIKKFYDDRGKNEALEKYEMELDYERKINAFDFFIGFQNYCSEKYTVIHNFESSGLSLFFKLFKYLYSSLNQENFTIENVNKFIEDVNFACDILNSAYNSIFQENIDENIFNKSAVKNKLLIRKNPMMLILISNIVNKNIEKKKLINENKKCIIYHFLSNKKYLKNISDEDFVIIKEEDKIQYTTGSAFIDNMCNTILNKDKNKIFNISKDKFKNLLKKNIKYHINEKTYNDERKTNKRRKLNLLDKILISNYWNRNIPNKHLKEKYSIEHITPYSSIWNDTIDIDRLGNIFPTLEEINSKRGNKSLSIYKEEYPIFYDVVKSLLHLDEYENINLYENRKNTIKSIESYNNICTKNEKLYVNNLIDELYK